MLVKSGCLACPPSMSPRPLQRLLARQHGRLHVEVDVEPIADVEKIQTKRKTETKRVKTPTRGRFAPLAQVPPTSFPFLFPFSFSFEFIHHPQIGSSSGPYASVCTGYEPSSDGGGRCRPCSSSTCLRRDSESKFRN